MRILSHSVVVGLCAFVLAACATPQSANDAEKLEPTDDAFLSALHGEYVALARKEEGYFDWLDARVFVRKATDAAHGLMVMPEDVSDWSVDSAEQRDELNALRTTLLELLDGNKRSEKPQLAAHAQAMFDCLVEELEEGPIHPGPVASHQESQIAQCDTALRNALEELAYVPPKPVVRAERPSEFTIYFGHDSADLTETVMEVLNTIARETRIHRPKQIVVNGHADASGKPLHNLDLSKDRAHNVAQHLIDAGVKPERVETDWFGEAFLAVDTDDGVRHPENRRVVVTFEY